MHKTVKARFWPRIRQSKPDSSECGTCKTVKAPRRSASAPRSSKNVRTTGTGLRPRCRGCYPEHYPDYHPGHCAFITKKVRTRETIPRPRCRDCTRFATRVATRFATWVAAGFTAPRLSRRSTPTPLPLSSESGTCKTANARFWSWLAGRSR